MNPNLRKCWHAVRYSSELTTKPISTDLLSEPLVLWRDSQGIAHAFADLCIHRGTALSLGTIQGDEIVCAYHGWRYCGTGACTYVPQLENPRQVPVKAKVTAYDCMERYGLVWVALEKPKWNLPEIPEIESSSWKVVETGPFTWKSDASRQVENFTDFGHFPFVHPGLLGDPERTVVPSYDVRTEDHVLHYEIVRPEAPNTGDFPIFANPEQTRPERRSRYELHLPYTIVLRLGWGGKEGMVYFFTSQPAAEERSTGYCSIARNYDLEKQDETFCEFEAVIFGQDQRVVESQRPEKVPFDLAAELHLRSDAVAVAYRRAMKVQNLS